MLTQRIIIYAVLLVLSMPVGDLIAIEQSNDNNINFSTIKQFAELANASYQLSPQLRKPDLPEGYALTYSNNIPGLNVVYFLATNDADKKQIIAVRGTANVENALVDAALQLRLDKHTGIRLHNGFSQAALAIYDDIKPKLIKGYVINTTGHSLGGAIALILAMHMDVDQYTMGKIITFGQPKVSNIIGSDKFKHLNVTRVVTAKDLVPLVPPLDLTDFNNVDIYWHQGKEVILLPGIDYAVLEGSKSMLRATGFTREPLTGDNLTHHQMALYLRMIDKKIPTAKKVEFKNSLNLFNLF
jgi:hypothetical protein